MAKKINKDFLIKGSGIMLRNNKKKDIIKEIMFLENRGILSKETTRKITCAEWELLIFLDDYY